MIALAAGLFHSLALCSDGTVAAWGYDRTGELGDGGSTDSAAPVQVMTTGVLAGKTVIAISAGMTHSLVLCSDGTVVAWGENYYGQLGDNSQIDRHAPVLVTQTGVLAGKSVVAVAAGGYHSLALCSDGTVAAWGGDAGGVPGNSSSVPVLVTQSGVLAGRKVSAISAGASHSLALCTDGAVVAWGINTSGQLGNNTTVNSAAPVLVTRTGVLDGESVVAISAAGDHSVALCSDGRMAAWGQGGDGQLGNNGTTDSSVPVLVTQTGVLAGKMVAAVSTGTYHSTALCGDGTAAGWGDNSFGQLGNNSGVNSPVPVVPDTTALAPGECFTQIASGSYAYHLLALVGTPGNATPLVLDAHADADSTEATGPTGAVVSYAAATATDDTGEVPVITYSQESGTVFPLGQTMVTATATDADGNSSTTSFKVTVVDTTPPVITPPSDQVAVADGSGRAVVTYPPTAVSDSGSGVSTVTYSQECGTSFAEGVTDCLGHGHGLCGASGDHQLSGHGARSSPRFAGGHRCSRGRGRRKRHGDSGRREVPHARVARRGRHSRWIHGWSSGFPGYLPISRRRSAGGDLWAGRLCNAGGKDGRCGARHRGTDFCQPG